MANKQSNPEYSGTRKNTYQWLAFGLVIGLLYITGYHTNVIAGMQRAMLYTGLFNAQAGNVEADDGPYLNSSDYGFSMNSSNGETKKLSELKDKVIFVNVWASWCPPCLAEMPTIESLYSQVSGNDGIRFIMLSVDQNRDDAVRFMENKGYTMPYQFPGSQIPEAFYSPVLPTTYVVSRQGQIVYKKKGIADYSTPAFRNWLIELAD